MHVNVMAWLDPKHLNLSVTQKVTLTYPLWKRFDLMMPEKGLLETIVTLPGNNPSHN